MTEALTTMQNGNLIIWNGHACEGADLTPGLVRNFCFWTRCGKHDVPANSAYEGKASGIVCEECITIVVKGQQC